MKIHKIFLFIFTYHFAHRFVTFVDVLPNPVYKTFSGKIHRCLQKEIEFVSQYINDDRKLTQIHWGGGTPNAISLKYIKKVTDKIKECFDLSDEYEMAIECSPAHLDF